MLNEKLWGGGIGHRGTVLGVLRRTQRTVHCVLSIGNCSRKLDYGQEKAARAAGEAVRAEGDASYSMWNVESGIGGSGGCGAHVPPDTRN